MDVKELLRTVPLFANFSDDARSRLATRSVMRNYPKGSLLFTTGEPCRGLYVVESGRVRIFRTSPTGREQVLHTEIVLDRTREELSQELGTARESVSRALKQLAGKGVIEPLAGRRMRIPDVARLRTLGRPGERARYE